MSHRSHIIYGPLMPTHEAARAAAMDIAWSGGGHLGHKHSISSIDVVETGGGFRAIIRVVDESEEETGGEEGPYLHEKEDDDLLHFAHLMELAMGGHEGPEALEFSAAAHGFYVPHVFDAPHAALHNSVFSDLHRDEPRLAA
ncbi:MAG: hypothetical protein KDJ15_04355 [Alphaproteobacteria bacterium]|nr:hypothetical protein [Alphaproteobacteria bacterium]